MKIAYDPETKSAHVKLSKRNVLALLHKVDQDWSAGTIVRAGDPMNLDGEPHLTVQVEPDEVHYGDDPVRMAMGTSMMHPDTAEFIADPPSLDTYG